MRGIFSLPISLLVFIFLMIVGIYSLANTFYFKKSSVLSEQVSPSPTPVIVLENNLLNNSEKQVAIISSSSASPSSSTSNTNISKNESEMDLIYPGSNKLSGDSENFILESTEDAEKITEWYKTKIREQGFSTKTFVTTKTNGKVLNKLAGVNGSKTINIEISKSEDEKGVQIKIEVN